MFHLYRDRIYTLFDKPISQCRNSCSKLVEDAVQINIAKRRKSQKLSSNLTRWNFSEKVFQFKINAFIYFCVNKCPQKYDVTSITKHNFSVTLCAYTVLTINEYIQNLLDIRKWTDNNTGPVEVGRIGRRATIPHPSSTKIKVIMMNKIKTKKYINGSVLLKSTSILKKSEQTSISLPQACIFTQNEQRLFFDDFVKIIR